MTRSLQTVAAMACMKSLLMVFNFTFWISGIFILAIGIWMEVEWKYLELNEELSKLFYHVSLVLIATGALIILVGSLACCCTVKGQPMLLYLYGAFLGLVFLLELGAGISMFSYRSKLVEGFDKGLNDSMISYADGKTDAISKFDSMQTVLHCCGNHDYMDWEKLNPPVSIPKSCCIEPDCDTSDVNNIYKQGCYDQVLNFLESNIGLVAGTATGIALFPLCGLILSCCLGKTIKKAKYEEMA